MPLTFHKSERLCSRKIIEKLFSEGQSFLIHPFRVSFLTTTDDIPFPIQIVMAVGKRNHKNASTRNLVKRRMREAYRLQKDSLYKQLVECDKRFYVLINYIDKQVLDYDVIYSKMTRVLQKLKSIDAKN